jgi:hypothetical protein
VAFTFVVEVVHLLANKVGPLANAREHADFLEHRALNQPIPCSGYMAGKKRNEGLPAIRFGR